MIASVAPGRSRGFAANSAALLDGGDRDMSVREFAVREHLILGKKSHHKRLEPMTLNFWATLLEGEI